MAELYLKDDDRSFTYLESEIGYLNSKENCPFIDRVRYDLDGDETFVSIEKISGQYPTGITDNGPVTTDGEFLVIQGTPIPLDTYHEVGNYVCNLLTSNSDDYIPYSDVYEQIENLEDLELMTIGFLKNITDVGEFSRGHYSGRDYGTKGHLAYVMDGYYIDELTMGEESISIGEESLVIGSDPIIQFNFVVRLTYLDYSMTERTLDKEFYVKTIINIDPEVFLINYGNENHSLRHDNGEILTPEEYIAWRNSQGHEFLKDCS